MTYKPKVTQLTSSDFDYSVSYMSTGQLDTYEGGLWIGDWLDAYTYVVDEADVEDKVFLLRTFASASADWSRVDSYITINGVQSTIVNTLGDVDEYIRGITFNDYITLSDGDEVHFFIHGNTNEQSYWTFTMYEQA